MSLERDETRDFPGARKIKFGEDELVVAPLTLRQTLALADVTKKLFENRETGLVKVDAEKAIFGAAMLEDYVSVIVIGLRRAYPDVTRDDVLDLTGNVEELVAASTVVLEQAGGKKESTPGERWAASESTSSTGQSSSPA